MMTFDETSVMGAYSDLSYWIWDDEMPVFLSSQWKNFGLFIEQMDFKASIPSTEIRQNCLLEGTNFLPLAAGITDQKELGTLFLWCSPKENGRETDQVCIFSTFFLKKVHQASAWTSTCDRLTEWAEEQLC